MKMISVSDFLKPI